MILCGGEVEDSYNVVLFCDVVFDELMDVYFEVYIFWGFVYFDFVVWCYYLFYLIDYMF